ncbi:CD225/dispanin family protein [Frankia sp. Cppng1_Ct_nod]|uniref:CD225/dispanin family protein n=1 Tax=Frankia sp. Cppng1_Ct_nod TaxID=2897162 RepID=UPI0013EF8E92|nr:CD225/dispanin family protein [Frankia sp. Cppng1_Ct_nod]
MIRSYMPWAIAVTLLCFLPTGIAAIVYASRVSTYSAAGRWDSALEASRKAKLWTIISAVVGLSFAVIIFFAALSQPSTTY